MEKKISLIIIFLAPLFFINNTAAQGKFHIGANGGYTFTIGGGEYYSNQQGGINLGINFSYTLIPAIEITGRVGYSFIHKNNIAITVGPILYKPNTVYSPDKVNPDFYQTSFGIRIINPLARMKAFIEIQAGMYFMTNDLTPYSFYYTSTTTTQATQSIYEKFISFGFGFIMPLNSQIDFMIQGRYEQTFNKSQSLFPVTGGLRYNF